jgi:ABC-2 type transport system permease protein
MKKTFIIFNTLVKREVKRFLRIWPQTLVPPIITMSLYFLIFGKLIGENLPPLNGFSYITYIVPGLIALSVITNSYNNVVTSFYLAKFQRSIEEILVAPVSEHTIVLGYVIGGALRGLITALLVIIVASFFTQVFFHNIFVVIFISIMTACLFSMFGLLNAIFAKKFDDISIIPTFVLTPLTYLGGIFYSTKMLPPVWVAITHINPIFYIVNVFRYGMLGITDSETYLSIFVMIFMVLSTYFLSVIILKKGYGIKS